MLILCFYFVFVVVGNFLVLFWRIWGILVIDFFGYYDIVWNFWYLWFCFFFRKKDCVMYMVIDLKVKYKLKWNVLLSDVNIVEYGLGVNILINFYRIMIKYFNEGRYNVFCWFIVICRLRVVLDECYVVYRV